MIRINESQLNSALKKENTFRYFLTTGADTYLQFVSQNIIKKSLKLSGFEEQISFSIDAQTNWESIIENSQSMSLFSNSRLLILQFGDTQLNQAINKKLQDLCQILGNDVNLLISVNKLTKAQENAEWIKILSDNLVIVNCNTPTGIQLSSWITHQLQNNSLQIEKEGIDLLCYYYEGNLLALSQLIEQLNLLYPSGKISYPQLEQHLYDSSIFTVYHWIDAILAQKTKRAIHILQQLKINDIEPLILTRTIQKELILLIDIKKESFSSDLKSAYDSHKVWQNRRQLFTSYLSKITLNQLYLSLSKLTQIEKTIKSDHQSSIWEQINDLSRILMGIDL